MKKIEIKFSPSASHGLLKKVPQRQEVGTVLDEDCEIVANGKTVAVYILLSEQQVQGMRYCAENAKVSASRRSQGLPQKAAVFGPVPRKPNMGQDYCRFTKQSFQQKEMLPFISAHSEFVNGVYSQFFPAEFQEACQWSNQNINKDWKWLKGPYTNCNFNVNQAIPYHTDTANTAGNLSNVLILKKGIQGGELVCPELGLTFSQRDRAFILFEGKTILHGVRPIQKAHGHSNPYRASIVLYTLQNLKHCLCKPEELARAQQSVHTKTARTHQERKALLEPYRPKHLRKPT